MDRALLTFCTRDGANAAPVCLLVGVVAALAVSQFFSNSQEILLRRLHAVSTGAGLSLRLLGAGGGVGGGEGGVTSGEHCSS